MASRIGYPGQRLWMVMQASGIAISSKDGKRSCAGADEHVPATVLKVHNLFTRNAKLVLGTWTLLCILGGTFATYFISKSQDRLTAPFHSRAAREEREFFRLFPDQSHQDVLLLYAESSERTIVCPSGNCKRTCTGMDPRVAELYKLASQNILSRFPNIEYLSFFNVSQTKLDPIKCQFASEDGRATFGIFTYNPVQMKKSEIHTMIESTVDIIDKYFDKCETCADLYAGVTGVDVLAKEAADATEQQLVRVDTFTMPVAFFIFYMMVRSWRLLLLCIWNMIITVATSFGTLSLFVKVLHLKPMSIQATFAQALAVAMSIDYSLFLLRRFRDEKKNGRSVEDASKVMLSQAGHVVALSCGTFILVFVGFLFLPSSDLMALGEVAVVTLFFAFCVNISNTIAALHVFPDFFSKFTFAPSSSATVDAETGTVRAPLLLRPTPTGKPRFRRGAPYKGLYFKFLTTVTRFPFNIIFVVSVYALFIPLALQALRLKHNQNAVQITPQSAQGAKTYRNLQNHFAPGLLGQFNLIVASDDIKANSREFFGAMETVIDRISKESEVPLTAFLSPTCLNGQKINYLEASQLRNSASVTCLTVGKVTGLCELYQYVWGRAINDANSALVATVQVPFNPYSRQGIDFVLDTRRAIDTFVAEKNGEYQVLLTGNEVEFYEDMDLAFGSLSTLIITTLCVVFILLSLGFKSAFVPIRLSLTVFIPIATVFGLAVLVYQDGLFEFMHLSAFKKTDDGFFWFVPIVCLFEMLGLVLDYDILLAHRVMEHRESGYQIQAAIIKSIWEIQSTVVAAGLIMASVFGGILLSDEIAVDQFGFLMCASVLADTLIVQVFLIGPVISLGDGFMWWPRHMPTENLITLDDEEFAS